METTLNKLDSYLNDHYLDIEDNTYLFFKWILDNKDYIVFHFPTITMMFKQNFQKFENIQTDDALILLKHLYKQNNENEIFTFK